VEICHLFPDTEVDADDHTIVGTAVFYASSVEESRRIASYLFVLDRVEEYETHRDCEC
jgi:predicted transcriptional regulator